MVFGLIWMKNEAEIARKVLRAHSTPIKVTIEQCGNTNEGQASLSSMKMHNIFFQIPNHLSISSLDQVQKNFRSCVKNDIDISHLSISSSAQVMEE